MTLSKIDTIKQMYRDDAKNIAMPLMTTPEPKRLPHEASEAFTELLIKLKTVIAVTLEYEHMLALIYVQDKKLHVQYLEIPHPSGIFFDGKHLLVSSTRSPNQIIFFRMLDKTFSSETLPRHLPNLKNKDFESSSSRLHAPLLIPVRSYFFPGHFSIHDVVKIKQEIYFTVTGLNFVAKTYPDGGFERVWHPKCVDYLRGNAFTTNYLQLNSMARGSTLKDSFFTAFSDQPTEEKPWKKGYGPKGKGVVFEGSSRETIYRGLTCPHSARKFMDKLWLCNSGMGELGTLELKEAKYTPVAKIPGFTRGLAFLGPYAIVGFSKVIPTYEPYAPGLDCKKSQCGIAFVNTKTGSLEATLVWPDGFQIYDVQTLGPIENVILPANSTMNSMNYYLTYYGWDRKWKSK